MLDSERLAIWSSLAAVLERLPAALDAQLQQDSGLTHFEYGVLYALDAAPDRTLRLSTLAGYANCTLSRLSRAVDRLQRAGRVTRSTDPDNGRFTRATLTDDGHETVVRATPGHEALVERVVFDALTGAQARQLGAIATRIAQAVGPTGTWSPPAVVAPHPERASRRDLRDQ